MTEPKVWTVEDTRRMLKGLPPRAESSQGEAIPPVAALPSGAVSATVETVKTVMPSSPAIPRLPFAGLGLSAEQQTALVKAGINDRATLTTALDANGDKGYAGLTRTQVRALRKKLEAE